MGWGIRFPFSLGGFWRKKDKPPTLDRGQTIILTDKKTGKRKAITMKQDDTIEITYLDNDSSAS